MDPLIVSLIVAILFVLILPIIIMSIIEARKNRPKDEMKRPTSVLLLTILYSILGIGWIFVSIFGIWKMKRWALNIAIVWSIIFTIAMFYFIFSDPPQWKTWLDSILGIILGSLFVLSMPVTTAYVYLEHGKDFK